MKYVASEVGTNAEDLNTKDKKVNWEDYNYPCCLQIFHYNSEETPDVLKRKVAFLRVNHILMLAVNILNFIANIVDTAQGVPQGGIRIAISVFAMLFWLPISFYIFHIPYRVYLNDQSAKPWVFYLLSFFVFVWYFIWSIADFADANGFIMIANNVKNDRGAAVFFAIVVSIVDFLIALLTIMNVGYFCKRDVVVGDE